MTAMSCPYQSYRQVQVETADPLALLMMLYNGALKFLRQGTAALKDHNVGEANRCLIRVQDILCELMGSLSPDTPELSGNLFQIYEFMHHRVVQANVKRDPALADDVEQMLLSLMEAWRFTPGAPVHG